RPVRRRPARRRQAGRPAAEPTAEAAAATSATTISTTLTLALPTTLPTALTLALAPALPAAFALAAVLVRGLKRLRRVHSQPVHVAGEHAAVQQRLPQPHLPLRLHLLAEQVQPLAAVAKPELVPAALALAPARRPEPGNHQRRKRSRPRRLVWHHRKPLHLRGVRRCALPPASQPFQVRAPVAAQRLRAHGVRAGQRALAAGDER
ncbi:hypothetical protein T492DRAFT_1145742, partial [Pavlovales sp. CCMP2436]